MLPLGMVPEGQVVAVELLPGAGGFDAVGVVGLLGDDEDEGVVVFDVEFVAGVEWFELVVDPLCDGATGTQVIPGVAGIVVVVGEAV